MRFSILAAVPFLMMAVVSADYSIDSSDASGNNHEKYSGRIDPSQDSACQTYNHGMMHFATSQNDAYRYKYNFYEDGTCGANGGARHEREFEKDDQNESPDYSVDTPCYSFQVRCKSLNDN